VELMGLEPTPPACKLSPGGSLEVGEARNLELVGFAAFAPGRRSSSGLSSKWSSNRSRHSRSTAVLSAARAGA
jgi:hypothetical protein